MKASVKLWAGFRMCRVVVFAIGTIMSMALSVLYAVLLLREWNFYSNVQRTIVSIILAIYGLSTILLYLMIIVRFRLWLDGARVSFLALFQGGATVSFVIFKSSLPCNNLSTVQTCETVSTVIIFGSWSLTGLLVFYAFCLAIMSHIPRPPPPNNPEDGLSDKQKGLGISSSSSIRSTSSTAALLNHGPGKWEKEKRHSFLSDSSSGYSQTSWIGSRPTTPSQRSNSLESRTRMEQYRPYTPKSIRSPAGGFTSGPGMPTSTPGAGGFTPQPSGRPTSPRSPQKARLPHLPNPFVYAPVEPMSRSGTPVSVASFRSDGFLYTAPYTYMRSATAGYSVPRPLVAGAPPLPPAYMNYPRGPHPGSVPGRHISPSPGPHLALERLHNNSTPFIIRPGVTTGDIRDSLTSPGAMTVLSQSASIRIPPNRRASLLSLPRSPSPHNIVPRTNSPAPQKVFLPPGHPRLHPMNLRGPQRFHEFKRLGSPADLRPGVPASHARSPTPPHGTPHQTIQVRFVTQ